MKNKMLYFTSIFGLIIACLLFLPSLILALIVPDGCALTITDENKNEVLPLVEIAANDIDDMPDMTGIDKVEYVSQLHKYRITVYFDDGSDFFLY